VTSVADTISKARHEGRAALVGYLPAGFPSVARSIEFAHLLVDCGLDIIEVGLPYSDPVMDGPTIQRAAEAALAAGVRTRDVLAVTAAVAEHAPALVMTYWNPVERYGVARLAADLAASGGAGLITPDLIPDEAGEWMEAADRHGLDRVFLVAPASSRDRLASASKASRGFVYAAAVMGVTGARERTGAAAAGLVARVREVTDRAVGVGIGVSTGRQAAEVAAFADAVIVGSAIVAAIQHAGDHRAALHAVAALARDLSNGVRGNVDPS